MKTWYEVYLDEIESENGLSNYFANKIKTKKPLLDMVRNNTTFEDKIIEAGCGTGIVSTYLASLGYDVTSVDIDNNILRLADDIAEEYCPQKKPQFVAKSIFELNYPEKYFKVSFSSGVLEHFDDELIIKAIKTQLRIAEFVVISIPTEYFDQSEALYGDERFMSIKKWRNLISDSGGKIIEEKSGHFLKFPYCYLNIRKTFRPWPYKIFLVKQSF